MTYDEAEQLVQSIEELLKEEGVDTFFVCFHRPIENAKPGDETTGHYSGSGGHLDMMEMLDRCKAIVQQRVKRQ